MSVPEQVPYKEYRATGSNNSFEITFYLPDPKDLVVMVNKEIPLVGAYSIVGDSVVFSTPPNEGDLVELTRDTQLDRETNFKSYDNSFRPETINFDLDKIWLALQESNLVDAKILARLKQEIEWRRTHDFNYDELAQVREKQLFDALKGYTDTLNASTNPGVFQGVIAGVVFARDGKSIQTHLEEILEALVQERENIDSKADKQYVDDQLGLKADQKTTYSKNEVDSALDQKASKADTYTKAEVDTTFSSFAGGRKGFTTLALAQAAQSTLPADTVVDVTNDPDPVKNGTYQWNGTTLTKSAHDPLTQAKGYTSKTGFAKIAGNIQANINYDTSNRTLTFSGAVHITTGTSRVQLTTPQSVVLDQNVMYRLEFNVDTGLIRAQGFTQNYFEGYIPFAFVRAYPDKIKTTDFQYAINGVAFDAIKIATDASAIDATNKVKVLEDKIVSQSSNLYDASAATVGKVILTDGSIVDNAQHSITDFIAVLPSQQYTIKAASSGVPTRGFNAISYFDVNKNFIKRDAFDNTGSGSVSGALTLTMPSNAYYIRLNMQDLDPTLKSRQINKGSEALPYELYKPTVLKVDLSQENIDQVLAQATDTAKPYIVQSTNLYDASAATVGYAILEDGTVSANAVYSHSDFIKVESNQKYTAKAWSQSSNARIRGFNAIAYYDANMNFISRVFYDDTTVSADGVGVFTTLSNAEYIRLNMQDTDPARLSRQVNKGVADIPFEPYRVQLSNIALASDVLHQIGSELQIEKSDGIMFDLPVDGVFNTNEVWSSYTGFRTITANAVYAMYDALQAAHPNYISKQVLGQDDFGYTISCYKFIPKRPSVDVSVKKAKIFITCGTHGYEHMPPLAMYLLLEQMCNNWQSDPLLEVLRYNVDILIIPVVNPSGFDDFTRKNRNGVDINRNFPPNFGWQSTDPESSFYGGAAPLDQKESQYIEQVFNENPDINIMYDFHNFHGTNAETHPHYIWIANAGDSYVQHMAQILNQRMTRKWRKELAWLPSDDAYFVGYASSVPGAQVQDQARAKGIKFASTFEVGERWWISNGIVSMYDATHCKTAVEAITNWLLINLNELKRI